MNEGLAIRLSWDGRRVGRVAIALQRPQAARLLHGMPAAQAVTTLPRLYRLCAKAQGVAARLALAAATGEAQVLSADERRALLAEQVQEHLWRLLRDWPALLGVAAPEAAFVYWYRRLAALPAEAAARQTLAAELARFIGEDIGVSLGPLLLAHLQQFAAEQPGVAYRRLPAELRAADFAAPWPADFAERPLWQGLPAATGCVGGDLPQSLWQRLSALIATAEQLGAALCRDEEIHAPVLADAVPLPDNGGLARVATARGMLLHRLQLDGQGSKARIASYQVLAPTEWNFHPQGPCAAALAGLKANSEAALRRLAGCWITAFDPCVGWQLDVTNEAGG